MSLVLRGFYRFRRISRVRLVMTSAFLLVLTCLFVFLSRQLPADQEPGWSPHGRSGGGGGIDGVDGDTEPSGLIARFQAIAGNYQSRKSKSSFSRNLSEDKVSHEPKSSAYQSHSSSPVPSAHLLRLSGRANQTLTSQQAVIVEAMRHSWDGYRKYAWGADHLRPISQTTQTWFGVGLTILDSLDSLLLMGMESEFQEALQWLQEDLKSFDVPRDVNCFETTIRCLGGILAAYHMSGEPVLRQRAVDLADRLIHCFDSRTSIPFSDVNLSTKIPRAPAWAAESSTSEVSTVQMEFRDVAHLTQNFTYEKVSFRTSEHLHDLVTKSGDPLVPIFINPYTGSFRRSTVTLGARGDSYYEYLLKQYLQCGERWLEEDYLNAMAAIEDRMVATTKGPLALTYVGELLADSHGSIHPKMDHLVCFLSGTLALGSYHSLLASGRGHSGPENGKEDNDGDQSSPSSPPRHTDDRYASHMKTATDLARTCYHMYNLTATGLSPEIAYFGLHESEDDLQIRPADAHNLLRPEYVESLFYLYHITGHRMYRDQGWKIFLAFQRYTRVPSGGYTTISDVRHPEAVRPRDMQESFWLSETLKYLFLLFSDDRELVRLILDHFLFNTEGHLLPRRVPA